MARNFWQAICSKAYVFELPGLRFKPGFSCLVVRKKASYGHGKAFFSAYCQKAGLCEGFLLTLAANFGNISCNMISLQNGVEENQTTECFY